MDWLLKVLFHTLNVISLLLSGLVYTIFAVMDQNFLIRSTSIICLFISIGLFSGLFVEPPLQANMLFCSGQAIFLNYFYVSIHAHFCFVMWNNLITATGWRVFGIDSKALVGLMFVLSVAVPIIPSILILAFSMENSLYYNFRPFYCSIKQPAWWGYKIWFIIFSAPGIIAAILLLYKTVKSRQKMLLFSNTSQFGKMQIVRMLFAIIIYFVLAITSIVIDLIEVDSSTTFSISDYLPANIGIFLFLIYGIGSVASQFYRKVYIKLGACMGIKVVDVDGAKKRSSFSSVSARKNSDSSTATATAIRSRKPSQSQSQINDPNRSRRNSQLSESIDIDEEFVYDLEKAKEKATTTTIATESLQIPLRRGSEPNTKSPRSRNYNNRFSPNFSKSNKGGGFSIDKIVESSIEEDNFE